MSAILALIVLAAAWSALILVGTVIMAVMERLERPRLGNLERLHKRSLELEAELGLAFVEGFMLPGEWFEHRLRYTEPRPKLPAEATALQWMAWHEPGWHHTVAYVHDGAIYDISTLQPIEAERIDILDA